MKIKIINLYGMMESLNYICYKLIFIRMSVKNLLMKCFNLFNVKKAYKIVVE